MKALRQRLNDDFDPTDADLSMSIAWQALRLMEVCQRILDAEAAGLRMGRDDASELGVRMVMLGDKLGLCESGDTESIAAFRQQLKAQGA